MQTSSPSLNSVLNFLKASKSEKGTKNLESMSEVAEYLSEPCCLLFDSPKSEVLGARRSLKPLYPALARIAKSVLFIQVSDVGVERLFSMPRDVVHYRRNRLHAFIIEDVMIPKKVYQIASDLMSPYDKFVSSTNLVSDMSDPSATGNSDE